MIMDGNFWCIYPRGKKYYTLGSVIYSRIAKPTKILKIAKKKITQFNNKKILQRINKFEKQVEKDFQNLKNILHTTNFINQSALYMFQNQITDRF